jgi:cell division protein FtsZ
MAMIEPVLEQTRGPRIVVAGIGGAGGNAVDNMIRSGLSGVDFIVINTDNQSLSQSLSDHKVQIGRMLTKGLGTGANPSLGEQAAMEDQELIREALEGADLVFITCGLGGGTGTGASPVVAKIAREMGALTVAIVTKPFDFEGSVRRRHAERGQSDLRSRVDTLITIPNQRLIKIIDEKTPLVEAFRVSDGVLLQCVRSISDLITLPGLINLDFADIRTIMENTGGAVMGVGFGRGENKAAQAFAQASSSPLMEEVVLEGAKGVLINITGGLDMTLHEINRAIEEQVNTKVDSEANIIFGSVIDESMEDQMKVTILATGFNRMEPAVERALVQEKELEPMHVTPKQYSNFDDPPYLHKRRPEARREREAVPAAVVEPEREIEAEAVPFSRMDREDILPSIFGNFK